MDVGPVVVAVVAGAYAVFVRVFPASVPVAVGVYARFVAALGGAGIDRGVVVVAVHRFIVGIAIHVDNGSGGVLGWDGIATAATKGDDNSELCGPVPPKHLGDHDNTPMQEGGVAAENDVESARFWVRRESAVVAQPSTKMRAVRINAMRDIKTS